MDVDEVLAGLSPAQRAELLERLQAEAQGAGPETDLEARVRWLEEQAQWRRGPGRGGRPVGGGPWVHHHWHCDHCGHCRHCDW